MAKEEALFAIGQWLKDSGYRFVTPTPATQARVLARHAGEPATGLRDIFGWSRPFSATLLPDSILRHLGEAGALDDREPLYRSRIRFSSLGPDLHVHSAYPTTGENAVFFGPDTYRFARLIAAALAGVRRERPFIVDIGCGSGAGGLVAQRHTAAPGRLVLADINPGCLVFARVNAKLAGIGAETVESDVLAGIEGTPDILLANPPYLLDPGRRLYRHGGGTLGAGLSLRILREGLDRLAPGGILVLYTGTAIVAGEDGFRRAAGAVLAAAGVTRWYYSEIDPDVFGEELDDPAYREAERIAAIGLVVSR